MCIQLIETKTGNHLFPEPYTRVIERNEGIFETQEEIVFLVLDKLNVKITPEEQIIIKEPLTLNPAALHFYQIGKLDYKKYSLSLDKQDLLNAKSFFTKAIFCDSTFAEPYFELAQIYINDLAHYGFDSNRWPNNGEEFSRYNIVLDSGMFMLYQASNCRYTNKPKEHYLNACYLYNKGKYAEAKTEFEKLWAGKTKDYTYYGQKLNFSKILTTNFDKIESTIKYLKTKPNTVELEQKRLITLAQSLASAGFPKLAQTYAQKLLKVNTDSVQYRNILHYIYIVSGNIDSALFLNNLAYQKDTTKINLVYGKMFLYYYKRDFENAFYYARLYDKKVKEKYGVIDPSAAIASLYLQKGLISEAKEHLDSSYQECMQYINEKIPWAQNKNVNGLLSAIYALQKQNNKALEQFAILSEGPLGKNRLIQVNNFHFFDNIRDEPEFKKNVATMEHKYQLEHQKVKRFLQKEGLLLQ